MILTRSPYYVSVDWVAPSTNVATEYDLELFVYDDLAVVPSVPTYTINKKNIESLTSGSDKVNISRIVNSFIVNEVYINTSIGASAPKGILWFKAQVRYYTATPSDYGTPTVLLETSICNGYSYGMEGENYTSPTSGQLIKAIDYKVSRNTLFSFPVKASATSQLINFKSYPDLNINYSNSFSSTNISKEEVLVINIPVDDALTDTFIEISVDSVVTTTLLITDECRYTPLDVYFINRWGVQQSITMFKARTDSMSVTNEEYETNYLQPSEGYHQFPIFNVQAKSSFKINSGFVAEEMNDVFKQLFLSEQVWIYENTLLTPVNLKSKSLEYKTRAKDRLINYEVEFEYSFNEINNI